VALRNVYVALGATAMPFLIHAAYGMRQPDPESYTVPVRGMVVSEETGEPVAGINVIFDSYARANTDGDGRFLIYVPKNDIYPIDIYPIRFFDNDGFENGGYFSNKSMSVTQDKIGDPLAVRLYRESQAAVIRGTVLSKGIGEPVSGILVYVFGSDSGESGHPPFSGFEVLSDNEGQFYIQVPERDTYFIRFNDGNGLFQWKEVVVTSDEIKDSLRVDLEELNLKEDER
jgi:hypothetical protein